MHRPLPQSVLSFVLCHLFLTLRTTKVGSENDDQYDILRRVIKPSLLIQGNEGRCSLCPELRFMAGADNETVSLIKQFEAHCRKSHKTREDAQTPNKPTKEPAR